MLGCSPHGLREQWHALCEEPDLTVEPRLSPISIPLLQYYQTLLQGSSHQTECIFDFSGD